MMVRIKSVTPVNSERVVVEGAEWSEYYRYGPGVWRVMMGDSEEPADFSAEWLEPLYQKFKLGSQE